MEKETEINKVVITDEAVFDYELVTEMTMPKNEIKAECESYMRLQQDSGRLLYDYYFRCRYLDEETDQMLMLFFYKGKKFGKMQMWLLKGVCLADDWDENLEYDGRIRAWLESSINPPDTGDWVVDLRVREEQRQKMLEDYND